MCTNRKKIVNHYTGREIYVSCGRCPACLQEKANRRAARIRKHANSNGKVLLFLTLTYANKYIPYIKKSDAKVNTFIPVYRDFTRRLKHDGSGEYVDVPCSGPVTYADTHIKTKDNKANLKLSTFNPLFLPSLKYMYNGKRLSYRDRVGVCYYKDWQDFFKRLRINYERKNGEKFPSEFWACSEYGETFKRPHFHALIACKPSELRQVRNAIIESWPFVGRNSKRVDIQIARNAASYVASYINCGSDFPEYLRQFFRPKYSMCRVFGTDARELQLIEILDKIKDGSLTFLGTRVLENRVEPAVLPIPKYIIHRFFPLFKGYSRLPADALRRVLLQPSVLSFAYFSETANTREDARKFEVRLSNCYVRFRDELAKRGRETSYLEYIRYYESAWNVYNSTLLKESLRDSDNSYNSMISHYDNLESVKDALPFDLPYNYQNDNPFNVSRTTQLTDLYKKKLKTSKVSNLAMTSLSYEV